MKKITINGNEYEVTKLPIGKYADLIKAIKKLPDHFQNFENLNAATIINAFSNQEAVDELLVVLSVASKFDLKELKELGLREIISLVEAVFEVNEYAEVIDVVKKAIAHPMLKNLSQEAPKNS